MKIISFDKVVDLLKLQEITSYNVFKDEKTFQTYDENGLHSLLIYPDEINKKTNLAYIDVTKPFIHPLFIKLIKKINKNLYDGLMGINPVKILNDKIKIADDGLIGIDLLKEIYDKKESLSNTKIKNLLSKYNLDILINTKILVIPESYRPITFINNYPVYTILDQLYIDLLKAIKFNNIESFSYLQSLIQKIEEEYFSIIKGKKGVIRDFLYSRRVDFSARLVVTVDPTLDINHISVPYRVLGLIFAPKIIHYILYPNDVIFKFFKEKNVTFPKTIDGIFYLLNRFYKSTLNNDIENVLEFIIDKVCENNLVVLKRDPVLHKHSVFSFYVIGKKRNPSDIFTCGISPLITTPLNMDFDGDTCAIFAPVTREAQNDLKKMLPSKNLYSVRDTSTLLSLKNEYALAIYLLTLSSQLENVTPTKVFNYPKDFNEIFSQIKDIPLNTPIKIIFDNPILFKKKSIVSTFGRYLLNLTHNTYIYINEELDKNKANDYFKNIYLLLSEENLLNFTKKITMLCDYVLKLYPISFSIEDFNIPKEYKEKLQNAKNVEEYDKILKDISLNLNEILKKKSKSVYIQMVSKARGKEEAIHQIMVSKGYTLNHDGVIESTPIKNSYSDGLSPEDIYKSAPGWRKGIIDSSLGTAISGYLFKKLMFLLDHLNLNLYDCKTTSGLKIKVTEEYLSSLKYRFLLNNKQEILKPEVFLNKEIILRSPLYCKDQKGICNICYGNSIKFHSTNKIGNFSAQAIGELGTQLTLRSFHLDKKEIDIQIIKNLPSFLKYKDNYLIANDFFSIIIDSNNYKITEDGIYIYPQMLDVNINSKIINYSLPFTFLIKKENMIYKLTPNNLILTLKAGDILGVVLFLHHNILYAVNNFHEILNKNIENFKITDILALFEKYNKLEKIPLLHFEILFSTLLYSKNNPSLLWRLNQMDEILKVNYLQVIKKTNPINAIVFYDPVSSIIDNLI